MPALLQMRARRTWMRSTLAAALAAIFTLGPAVSTGAQQQNLENVQVRVQPVQGNVYLLAGAGGNITLQIGKDGVLMVDTEFGPLAQKIMTEVRTKLHDVVGEQVLRAVTEMQNGDLVLLENLFFHSGEDTNDPEFAGELGAL